MSQRNADYHFYKKTPTRLDSSSLVNKQVGAWTENVYFPISEVCDATVSLSSNGKPKSIIFFFGKNIGFFLKVVMLVLQGYKVTTEHQKWPKIGQNSMISLGQRLKPSAEAKSRPA